MKRLIVSIPAYNEEKNIRDVILSIPKQIGGVGDMRIIVVNDGSTDATLEKIQDLDIDIIQHKKNQGLGKSFRDAVDRALALRADAMVNIDGDGQFDANDIPRLLMPIFRGEADFVSASRFVEKRDIPHMSKLKYAGNSCVTRMVNTILGRKFTDVSCGFRAYSREALLRLNLFGNFTYTQETFLDMSAKGVRMAEVPIEVKYFPERRSRMAKSIPRYAWRSFKIIFRTARDYKPLKVFGGMGIFLFVVGCVLDVGLLVYFLYAGTFSPYKIVGFAGGFLNIVGIMIFFIGLVADMLFRIRMNQEEILYRLKKEENGRDETPNT